MTALQQMAEAFTPSPVPYLPSVTSFYASVFAGWERIRTEPQTSIFTAATTPRSWCCTTWGLSTATTSPPR